MTREVRDSKNTLMRPKQVQAFKSRDSPSLRPGIQPQTRRVRVPRPENP